MDGLQSIDRDWLRADDAYLPTKQLPLLRGMLGRRLIDIQRCVFVPSDESIDRARQQDLFRKGNGPVMFELESLSPVYFKDSYTYDWDEKSINVSQEASGPWIADGLHLYRRYTLLKYESVDERLQYCIGQCITKIRILIRRPDVLKDVPRALQDGIEVSFENGTAIIVSYYLNKATTRSLQLLYPEEILWDRVQYAIDVTRGKVPWCYRFNKWKWRALARLERRLGLE